MNETRTSLQLILDRIAREGIPDDVTPWPAIKKRAGQAARRTGGSGRPWQRRAVWIAVALMAALAVAGAVYATTGVGQRLFSEIVGRPVDHPSSEGLLPLGTSQTADGITVTLDNAYFEANRIGIEYTVTGLPMATKADANEFTLFDQLLDRRNLSVGPLPAAGGAGVSPASGFEGEHVPLGEIKNVSTFDVTRAVADSSGLDLQFAIRVEEPAHSGLPAAQRQTVGPFVFDVAVPFVPNKDVKTFDVHETRDASGVPVTLEQVSVSAATVAAIVDVDPNLHLAPEAVNLTLIPPGGWQSSAPPPMAYVATQLGDTGRFRVLFHNNHHLLESPGQWRLRISSLRHQDTDRAGSPTDQSIGGPWEFGVKVP